MQILSILRFLCVVLPGFEPGQTEPKPVVLPLHHKTILVGMRKGTQYFFYAQIFGEIDS